MPTQVYATTPVTMARATLGVEPSHNAERTASSGANHTSSLTPAATPNWMELTTSVAILVSFEKGRGASLHGTLGTTATFHRTVPVSTKVKTLSHTHYIIG